MRRIFLDTETTGLDHRTGDRVIEIGCVELLGRSRSGKVFHTYLNPERLVPVQAIAIHGLTDEFLADKPVFAKVADEFLAFVEGAELVIHNADFDMGFLDNELNLLGKTLLSVACPTVTDSLKFAREIRPGRKNSLDALCSEYGVDNSGRELHGALRDAELLADVWLAMTRGQESMFLETPVEQHETVFKRSGDRPPLVVICQCRMNNPQSGRMKFPQIRV